MAKKKEVFSISLEEAAERETQGLVVKTGIFSLKGAYILSQAISFGPKCLSANPKVNVNLSAVCAVAIDSCNEVYFCLRTMLKNYKCFAKRKTSHASELALKRAVAYSLEMLWKMKAKAVKVDEHDFKLAINKDGICFTVSYDEFRALYETLKERKPESITKAHSEESIASVVGAPMTDVFKINAIKTMENELKELDKHLLKMLNELNDEKQRKRVRLEEVFTNVCKDIRKSFLDKQEDLKKKIASLNEQDALKSAQKN